MEPLFSWTYGGDAESPAEIPDYLAVAGVALFGIVVLAVFVVFLLNCGFAQCTKDLQV